MKTLYLDVFSGISGDMFIAAMIDLGADPEKLRAEVDKLRLDFGHFHVTRGRRASIAGVQFSVHLGHSHHHEAEADHDHDHGDHDHDHGHDDHPHEEGSVPHGRTFAQILKLISSSELSDWVKEKSLAVFHRVAVAEGKIHGLPPHQVHFHEVGAVDSIINIVGACVCLEMLGKPRVLASAVIDGTGWIDCAHGRLPVPAPATLEILSARSIPITQCEEPNELVTPTGAALLAEFAESFGPMRDLAVSKVGFGLGGRENKSRPNVLRAALGDSTTPASTLDWETDNIAVLETNLDDLSAEILGHFAERALASGALDVFHTPIQMKKSRPGVLFTVLCATAEADRFTEMILRETSAFGVRRTVAERRKLRREWITVKTPFGDAPVKVGKLNGKVVQAAPEFEACKKLAETAGAPLKEVYAAAIRAAGI